MFDANKAVQNGVRWLNVTQLGWRDKIDVGTFDINDRRYCILGQLGIDYRSLDDDFNVSHGFDAPPTGWDSSVQLGRMYNALQTAWLAELSKE